MSAEFRHREVVHHADVTGNAHFVQIQAFRFNLRLHAETDGQIDCLEYDESKNSDRDNVGRDADKLGNKLRRVAVEQTGNSARDAVPTVAIGSVREQAEGETTPCAVNTMDGDGADRIVDLELMSDEQGRFHNQQAGDDTDQAG